MNDKAYYEPDEPAVMLDRTTGEPYILTADGAKVWVD